jgi:hypothetical protein
MGWFAGWKERRQQRKSDKRKARALQLIEDSPEALAVAQEAFGGRFAITSEIQGSSTTSPYLTPLTSGLVNFAFYDSQSNMDRLLMASAWSWAAIRGNAAAISSLVPVVQERRNGGWAKAPDTHPLWTFLGDPLGTDDALPYWPWSQLIFVSTLHYYIAGNAWWVPQVVGGDIRAVTPILQPGQVTAIEDASFGAPIEYRITLPGRIVTLTPSQMVNIMAPSAGSFWRGSSALRAALVPVDTDAMATARQNANLNNYLGFGHILSTKQPLGPSAEQRAALTTELQDLFMEAVNQGKPFVAGGGIEVDGNPVGPELQIFDTKQFSRTEILAIIGMPPTVAGILDKAILNNFGVSVTTWWGTHLLPVLQQLLGSINAQMVQRVYGPATRIWYSLAGTDVGHQLLSAKLDVGLKLQTLGYVTNDINERLELEMPTRPYLDIPNQGAIIAGRAQDVNSSNSQDTTSQDDEVPTDDDSE